MNRDLALGGAALALAAGYYLMVAAIPESLLADAVGPQGLPKTYAVLLAGLALVLILRSLTRTVRLKADTTYAHVRSVRRQPDRESVRGIRLLDRRSLGEGGQPDLGSTFWRVTGLLAIGAAYVVAVPWLGYMLSIATLILATTYYQGGALTRQTAAIAACGAVVFWLLFVMLLGIPQPAGWWPTLL